MQIEFRSDAQSSVQGSGDPEYTDERDGLGQSQTWDPYEVWLKRVRQPRDDSGSTRQSNAVGPRSRARS
jgi:hypothetical protein